MSGTAIHRSLTPSVITHKRQRVRIEGKPKFDSCSQDNSNSIAKYLNEKYIQNSIVRHNILTNLKGRKRKGVNKTLDISTVVSVVDEYILPLFEVDYKREHVNNRKSYLGRGIPGPVYNEFKLSSRLHEENTKLRAELENYKKIHRENEQSKIDCLTEYYHLQQELQREKVAFAALNVQYDAKLKEWQINEQKFHSKEVSNKNYKNEYHSLLEENGILSKALYDAKADNDKMHIKLISLEHTFSLITMENIIIGERLVGLYESYTDFSNLKLTNTKFLNEISIVLPTLYDSPEAAHTLESLLTQKEFYFNSSSLLAAALHTQGTSKDQLTSFYKENLETLSNSYQSSLTENEKITLELDDLKLKFEALTREHQSARNVINRRKSRSELLEQKICLYCRSPYTEKGNFNWSCKRHRSAFSGTLYFCCGTNNKNAPGCELSKHISEHYQELPKIYKCFCPTCKKEGHCAGDCVLDPNIRSSQSLEEELQRVANISEAKRRVSLSSYQSTLQRRMIKLLKKNDI